MKKIEFESKEQLRSFIESCISFNGDIEDLDIEESIDNAEEHGYIKKSRIDVARERVENCNPVNLEWIESAINYMSVLEKEIDKLKENKIK